MTTGLAASVHARLLNRARERGEDFNLILTRYAIERFLYRLSLVPARDAYWLKGALLFDLWFDVPHRPTRMVSLGMANSRMKDYFDLRALAREGVLGARLLGEAIAATFQRRGTALPIGVPLGLSDEFARDATKRAQWKAFLGKNRLDAPMLDEVIMEIRDFVLEPLRLARERTGAA